MKKYTIALALILLAGCDDKDDNKTVCGEGTTLMNGVCTSSGGLECGPGTVAGADNKCVPAGTTKTFVQVEHLARPGINEALLLSDGYHAGFNATAPSFTGVPPATLDLVVGEAKTVLKAIYLGSCLVSGTLGLTAGTEGSALKPGLVACADVGNDIFSDGDALTGTQLSPTTAAQAQAYADRMFAQFIPDVMRIDTSAASNYLSPCGTPTDAKPLLCGGRLVNDDVIDVTYNYLIGGLAGTAGPQGTTGVAAQVRALTSDGVAFAPGAAGSGQNTNGLTDGNAANTQQGHPAVSAAFPYSAAPL